MMMWQNIKNILLFSLKKRELFIFLHQFSLLISAGVPLLQSLETLKNNQKNLLLVKLCHELHFHLLTGKKLSAAMKRLAYFNDEICDLIVIGEQTGQLDLMLQTVTHIEEKRLAFQNQLLQALFYPICICFIGCLVILFMLLFVLPRFSAIFHHHIAELPLFSRLLFYVADNLSNHFYIFFFTSIFLLSSCWYCFQLKKLHSQLASITQHLPFIRSLLKKIWLSRYVRLLALTLSAGLPILDALNLAAKTCHQQDWLIRTTYLRHSISTGTTLYQAMEKTNYFPAFMIQMIKTGETSGKLEIMLTKIADMYENDIQQQLTQLHKLLEPLIIVLLGVLIGGLVIGMYLPLFNLENLI
jgi:type IV pilus assembly protein PilC